MKSRKLIYLLFFLFILATTVRSIHIIRYSVSDYPSDAVAYQKIAKELATQGRYWHMGAPTAKWPPIWPFIVAGKFLLFGPGTDGLHAVQLGLSVITIGATFGIAHIIGDWRLGVISAIFLIFDPLHVGFTAMLLSGIPFVAFFTLSLLFYFRIMKSGKLIDLVFLGVLQP